MGAITTKDKITYSMGAGLMFCVMLYAFAVTWLPIPASGIDNSKTILGFLLGTVLGTIVGVYFGTNKSSQERSDMQTIKDAVTPTTMPDPSKTGGTKA